MLGASSFFVGRTEPGELGFHAIVFFSSYPVDLFGGVARFFLFAVVPAGFITSVPSRLVGEFHLGWALAVCAVATIVAALGWTTFALGLRRYTSGSVWTSA